MNVIIRPLPGLRRVSAGLVLAALYAAAGLTVAPQAQAATCPDVDVVFARGTGEMPGLGITGTPFVTALEQQLPGRTVSSYAVNYAADASQASAGPGATDMTTHVSGVGASCPNTRFVLGGYSQGASVTDIALGIRVGITSGTAIPGALAKRVAAVVVFGNPLGMTGRTIATASSTYGSRSHDYCNAGDPICGAGANMLAHLLYGSNGATTDGARFAAGLLASSAGAGTSAGTPDTEDSAGTGGIWTGSTSSGLAGLPSLSSLLSGESSTSGLASLLTGRSSGYGTSSGSLASLLTGSSSGYGTSSGSSLVSLLSQMTTWRTSLQSRLR